MNKRVKEIINELNVAIKYNPNLDKPAHYIPAINTIVLNSSLSEFEMTKALLHELGHASKHRNNYSLYNTTYTYHSKMESEANDYMISEIIQENDGVYNYAQLINKFNVGMGWDTHYYK
ncbi:ImmA/IrrE family metallo-endopeptidase [Tetragenococcus halophilus]|uniref:ImmA/IrrE family metallo-endopeptidase n=1 Tax=Tetragenococcus halophilus TaxID=51669 RepID=UPI00209B99E1|nr:ImmA/IrrE family metallo-endopeptidase [Tetragenococcus halophilus]MCO8291297.1 ImmA/IrrE family metallo-endopeptidase [Tetragenococcus halophilus]